MKHLYIFFTLIALLTCCTNDREATKKVDPAVQKIIEDFFDKYQDSPSAAVDYIFSTNNSIPSQKVSELKDKLANGALAVGAYNGYEQIVARSTSPSFSLVSYLVKHENQPLRFTFILYKPKDRWKLYSFKFDDSVTAELEESGRIYFIQ